MTGQHVRHRVRFDFKWYDIWIGVFVDSDAVYVCPLPCCVFRIERRPPLVAPHGE